MTTRYFSLIEGSLYRSPLRLLEAMYGERKRSWDLGYHHHKRHGASGFDDSKAVNKAAYKIGFDDGASGSDQGSSTREVDRATAIQTLKALPKGVLSNWFRNEDRSSKARLLRHIKAPEVRNAGMNLLHQVYQDMTGAQVPFDKFMDTPVRMYRAGGSPPDEPFTSYSMDRSIAERFATKRGMDPSSVSVIEIKPKDTLGSYQTIAEAEVLIPSWEGKDFLDGDPAFRGRSNHELRDAMEDATATVRKDRSRLPELKARYEALGGELKVREASGHQSRNPYEVDHSQQTSASQATIMAGTRL